MKIKLPKSLLDSLPQPDSEGLVRVTAAIKVSPDGNATIEELNDSPVPTDDSEEEGETDDANPMPSGDAESAMQGAPEGLY